MILVKFMSRTLLFCLCAYPIFFSCKSREFNTSKKKTEATPNQVGAKAIPTLRELLLQDTKEARSEIASDLENALVRFESEAKDEMARLMVTQLRVTAEALRNGAHSLCSPEERITFYRGTGAVALTLTDKPIQIANATSTSASIGDALLRYSKAGIDPAAPANSVKVSPLDFDTLSANHSKEADYTNTVFISVAASRHVAQSFGDNLLVVSLCPARAPSTATQVWAEEEFLPLLGILPEEIVRVEEAASAGESPRNLLTKCYAPDTGKGSRGISKEVSQQNFLSYNHLIVNHIEGKLKLPWKEELESFFSEHCDCAKMVTRKNALWRASAPTTSTTDFYSFDEECET
jgi:hypothetical protein